MRKLLLLLLICLLPTAALFAQDDVYNNKLSYGINFNTNGGLIGGIMVRLAHPLPKPGFSQFYSVEFVEVKHPKELRYQSRATGDTFVYGKRNFLYVIRPEYGLERILFRKAPESGIQVDAVLAVGPSIGMRVPYYIYYDYGIPLGTDIQMVHYDPIFEHRDGLDGRIRGNASFLTGLDETVWYGGAHVRGAINFEYGRYNESLSGVEVGFVYEVFPKEMVIMPQAENRQHFTSVYLTLFYGRRR